MADILKKLAILEPIMFKSKTEFCRTVYWQGVEIKCAPPITTLEQAYNAGFREGVSSCVIQVSNFNSK